MRLILLLLSSIYFTTAFSQIAGDCSEARYLKLSKDSTSFSEKTAPLGYGNLKEISAPAKDPHFFRKEHHTAWYKFRSPFSGTLSLEITPFDVNNDYDFLLFIDTTGNFCGNLINNKPIPVRSVISRNDPSIGSKTGLSAYSGELFIREGPGNSYGESIEVKKGQRFYLVLDNVYGGGKGHQIDFQYYYSADIKGLVVELGTDIRLAAWIKLRDDEAGTVLDSIKLGEADKGLFNIKKPLEFGRKYSLYISSEGYFDKITPAKRRKSPLKVELFPKRKNAKVVFEDINFYGNQDRFLPSAEEPLRQLLGIMQNHPTLKIEVGGHVNAAGGGSLYSSEQELPRYLDLSQRRAYAVQRYLIENGIAKSRIEAAGYGATQMLFPTTYKEREMMKNRRVEIKILEF